MRCHVCGATIGDVSGGPSDLPPVMDGWAWTVATDGSLDIVTCADCTKLMRPLVGPKPGQEPEYGNQVVWAVGYLVGQRFDAARFAGSRALRAWCDEAVAKPDYDARRSLVFGCLYGLDGEQLKQSLARLPGGAGAGCSNWKSRTSETDWAKEEKVTLLDVDGKFGPHTEEQIRQIQAALNRVDFSQREKLTEWAKQLMPKDEHHSSWAAACEEAFGVLGDMLRTKKCKECADKLAKFEKPMPPASVTQYVARESSNKMPAVGEAAKSKCVRCGDPAITRYSKTAMVPFCGHCVAVADASTLPEDEKEAIVRKVGMGDRYAWQRLVETQPEYTAWERSDAWRVLARVVSDQPRESAWERRRRRLREHPEEHLVKVLGMADMFGPKVR